MITPGRSYRIRWDYRVAYAERVLGPLIGDTVVRQLGHQPVRVSLVSPITDRVMIVIDGQTHALSITDFQKHFQEV